jgi:hypothetical protein
MSETCPTCGAAHEHIEIRTVPAPPEGERFDGPVWIVDRRDTDRIAERDQRISDLEGALSDALSEIRILRAWRERAWDAMRETGVQTRELMAKLDLAAPSDPRAGGLDGSEFGPESDLESGK